MAVTGDHTLRIGELSRRVGVSTELLRAWERRYGLLRPARTAGGFRLYSSDDERRVRSMLELLARGLSAAEAARVVLAETWPAPVEGAGAEADAARLAEALEAFDEQSAHLVFDGLLAALTVETLLARIVVPYLRDVGDRWQAGELSVAQEHFVSQFVRGRLIGLARGWDRGDGPRALLACPPGELHDLGLLAFGVALRGHGWRITFLGADTPVETLAEAARLLSPRVVVLSAVVEAPFRNGAEELAALGARHRVAIAGAGASPQLAEQLGCSILTGDPVSAVGELG